MNAPAQAKPVIIIGAGISGLAAAAKISQARIPLIILEARDRIGGRILTQHDESAGFPIELGAEFIHGEPAEILQQLPKSKIREVDGQNWCVSGSGLSPCSFFSEVDSILDAMDDSVPDESFLDFLARCFPNPSNDEKLEEAKRRAVAYISGFNAADPGLVSEHWLVAQMRAEEKIHSDRAFRPRNGYSELVDGFRQQIAKCGIRIETGSAVESIAWKTGNARVNVRNTNGRMSFESSRILLTLPVSILKSSRQPGSVEFIPQLPKDKVEAISRLEMGKVIRVILRFKHRFWDTIPAPNPLRRGKNGTLSNMSFLFSEDDLFPTWWTTMPDKQPIITAWAPFRSAEKLSGRNESSVVREALQTLARLLGANMQDLEQGLDRAYFHDWQEDPFSRGAYSYARVGADGAQEALSMPVDNTLFFAGEAADTSGNNGTVHGAIASGYRAARQIIEGSVTSTGKTA